MKLKQIDSPELHKLVGYLQVVSDIIRTGELKWYFDISLFEYEGDTALNITPAIKWKSLVVAESLVTLPL
jgi:hypothetical protein